MVNILKHKKFNKNPFVKHLKEFSKYSKEEIEDIKRVSSKGSLIANLDEERKVVINQSSIYLVNSKFSSFGVFEIPIEDFNYNSGNFYIILDHEEQDIAIFFSSKKELYQLVNGFDSLKESEMKTVLSVFKELGIKRNDSFIRSC